MGNYEVYRKFVGITLETERTTVAVADDKRKIATIDKLTVDERSLINMPVAVIRYQYDNHLGSASLELDATAQIISYEEYHPFGTTSYRSGKSETEVSLKRYKYVGKERDEETGLYYYGFRYYAPWIARFINVDPLQHEYPHYTPFQYAGNKPITYVDLDGLEEKNSTNPFRLPTLELNKYHDGTVNNSTPLLFIDNLGRGFANGVTGLYNFVFVDIPDIAAYNISDAYNNGTDQWKKNVSENWSKEFNSFQSEAVSFLQKPADQQWMEIADKASNDVTFNFGCAIALYTGPGLMFKPKPSIGSFDPKRIPLKKSGKPAAVPKAAKAAKSNKYAYRSLNTADAVSIEAGNGIYAKAPNGVWSLEEHLVSGSSSKAFMNDPWIATSTDINVARSFSSGNGLVRIDLSKMPASSMQRGYLSLPRSSVGYHYSVWQNELSIYQHIPQNCIKKIK